MELEIFRSCSNVSLPGSRYTAFPVRTDVATTMYFLFSLFNFSKIFPRSRRYSLMVISHNQSKSIKCPPRKNLFGRMNRPSMEYRSIISKFLSFCPARCEARLHAPAETPKYMSKGSNPELPKALRTPAANTPLIPPPSTTSAFLSVEICSVTYPPTCCPR